MGDFERVEEAAAALKGRVGMPAIGIVLGSGLGDLVDLIDPAVSVPYGELPHWPVAQVEGHAGRAVAGMLRGRPVIALAGRSHFYEGVGVAAVTFAVRVLAILGVRVLVLTNAAGGINTAFTQGALMLIDDHINMLGTNPLVGPNVDELGVRFPDMTYVYDRGGKKVFQRVGPVHEDELVRLLDKLSAEKAPEK